VVLMPDLPSGVAGGGGHNPTAWASLDPHHLDLVSLLCELLDEVCLVEEGLATIAPVGRDIDLVFGDGPAVKAEDSCLGTGELDQGCLWPEDDGG